jgi:membrane protease YdiL (CAAX protease family)
MMESPFKSPFEPPFKPPFEPPSEPPPGPPRSLPPPGGAPPVWTAFAVVVSAVGMGYFVSVLALWIVALGREGASALRSSEAVARATQSFEGLMAAVLAVVIVEILVVAVATRLSDTPARVRLRLDRAPLSPGILAAAAGAMLLLSHGLDSLAQMLQLYGRGTQGLLVQAFREATPIQLVVAVLAIAVAAGTAEEILFRGYLQTRLSRRWGPRPAVIVTSLLFGVAHFDPVQGSGAVFLGLYLGAITEWTGSIRLAIFCHIVNNLFATLAPTLLDIPSGPEVQAGSVVVAVLGLAAALPWLRRRLQGRRAASLP